MLAVVTSLPNAVTAVYLARRVRGAAVPSTALNSNAINVTAWLDSASRRQSLLPGWSIGRVWGLSWPRDRGRPAPAPSARELLGDNARRRARGLGRALPGLMDPGGTLRKARRNWPAWLDVAGQRAPVTSLNSGRIGLDRRLALVRADLDAARTIARAHGGTVNDVVLVAVAGGLRDLLLARGEPVGDLVLRASVPVSLHQEQSGRPLGNQVGWMAVPLPVGEPRHARRLALIAAATAERKKNGRPQIGVPVVLTEDPTNMHLSCGDMRRLGRWPSA